MNHVNLPCELSANKTTSLLIVTAVEVLLAKAGGQGQSTWVCHAFEIEYRLATLNCTQACQHSSFVSEQG